MFCRVSISSSKLESALPYAVNREAGRVRFFILWPASIDLMPAISGLMVKRSLVSAMQTLRP